VTNGLQLLDTKETNTDIVLEFYRQAQLNARAFIELRFKHFTTYMVLTGLLAAGAFNKSFSTLTDSSTLLSFIASTMTVLFWVIDRRTGHLFQAEADRIRILERALNFGSNLVSAPAPRFRIRSSTATNLIFLISFTSWYVYYMYKVLVGLHFLPRYLLLD
jgi:hypothetical protein